MIFWLFWKLNGICNGLMHRILSTLMHLCGLVAIAHMFGWIERWIWWSLEQEASKVINGTKVTIGSFSLDWSCILQGKVTLNASNVVVHTPQRELWGWESPLVARVGKARVECNAPITLFHFLLFQIDLPVEIYTIQIWDVQVFVERHENVFNVYLMDPNLELPPPPYLGRSARMNSEELDSSSTHTSNQDIQNTVSSVSSTTSVDSNSPTKSRRKKNKEQHKEQAEQLVDDMLHAVQSLQRAAHKGSLQSAVKKQGLELANRFRVYGKKENLDDGMQTLRQVGKVAVASLKSSKVVLPEKKLDPPSAKVVYCRVGRIVLKDMRVFTKDSWIRKTSHAKTTTTTTMADSTTTSASSQKTASNGGWNKPIFIEQFIVRGSELAPPLKMNDEDGLPAMYQNIDKVVEVVWRKLLAEMAKSNTGRLFQTAVGEVLSIIKTNGKSGAASLLSSNSTSTGMVAVSPPSASRTGTSPPARSSSSSELKKKSPDSPVAETPTKPQSTPQWEQLRTECGVETRPRVSGVEVQV